MYFHDVIGQDDLKARLTDTARRGIIPHARLFCGRTGSGTFPLALAYARYLNCSDRTDTDACGKCHSCRQYDALAHPDLYFTFPIVADKKRKRTVCDDYLGEWRAMLTEHTYFDLDEWLDRMETAGKQALIYAEESDQMIRKTSLRIYEAQYRVLIVWMPERMHAACANKLLKLIEEPPARTVILMVSDAPDLILGTILSRTQRLDVRPIEADALTRALEQRNGLPPDAARRTAHLAHGDLLAAERIMGQDERERLFLDFFIRIMRNAWKRDVRAMKQTADELAALSREQQRAFLAYCQHLVRENFVRRFQSDDLNYLRPDEAAFSARFSPYVNERNVFDFAAELADAERHITQNGNAKMIFFDLTLRITVLLKK